MAPNAKFAIAPAIKPKNAKFLADSARELDTKNATVPKILIKKRTDPGPKLKRNFQLGPCLTRIKLMVWYVSETHILVAQHITKFED